MEISFDSFLHNDDDPPSKGDSADVPLPAVSLIEGNNVRTLRPKKLPFTFSEQTASFYRKHFPYSTPHDWCDWHWQIKNRITTLSVLERIVDLRDDERSALQCDIKGLPFSVTPYYMSLVAADNYDSPLRKTVIPRIDERRIAEGEEIDPLSEESDSPMPGIIHRYPDRVLFLVTEFCSVFCRYCTRSRMVTEKKTISKRQWENGIEYIRNHPEIRDVLISGGDPLTLPTEKLDWLLGKLREIKHVEIIRIGTKVPAVLPQRITNGLVAKLKKHHPLWISVHFTHPDEFTEEAAEACRRLANAGIPLGSQTVLLKEVNDSVGVMKPLVHSLLKNRVKPYYLYQCDPIVGSSHFRTKVSKGIEIIESLRGHTSGYAVFNYVIDAPGGGGKIPLLPEYFKGRDEKGNVILRNYEGNIFSYPDF